MPSGIFDKSPEFKRWESESRLGAKNPFFGRKHTQETKDKIARLAAARSLTEEQRKKISAYHKGRKHSAEHAEKISKALIGRPSCMKGKTLSLEHRIKIGLAQKGSKSNSWKGGRSPEKDIIRASAQYKNWRRAVFERDDYTCQICLGRGGMTLNADHIKPFALYPELRFELSNGRTLCWGCHIKTDTFGSKTRLSGEFR